MIERWSRDQVLALAPDAPSRKAAQEVAAPGSWTSRGVAGDVLFGACEGSGPTPYETRVDLAEPAYRCTCPSRKLPCKHVLGLLLLWSAGHVPTTPALPSWAADRLAHHPTPPTTPPQPPTTAPEATSVAVSGADSAPAPAPGAGTASRAGSGAATASGVVRQGRVAAGMAELERWLADQVRQGLAGAGEHDWEGVAKRLVDAQAPGAAGAVSRLARVRAMDDWPGRLLEEYALLHLLAVAYRRRAELPPDLAETVMMRTGFPVTRETVLTRPPVRDLWDVLGLRDETQDRLTARRVWLRGRETGRAALVLSFAPPGRPLDASLVNGSTIDADLAFYPGAAPLRALVATYHPDVAAPAERVPPGLTPDEAMGEVAAALAADPWTDSWPLVLAGVVPDAPSAGTSAAGAASVGGFPLRRVTRAWWRLLAVSGGRPVTVAAEWTPYGLNLLTTWDDDGMAVIL
ncbi:SWIM zinc finger family protein [Nonomuraea sp. ATR24]|uniref:SWIM zinc finger family protein n=1 Tax=Nonomuraea sp. ATR24 TaxID=1676744 RepID=UPI0035C262C8